MRRRSILRAAIFVLITAVILIIALVLLRNYDQEQYTETRGTMSEGFGQLKTVEWNGSTYREKPAVTTLLIAGIDKVEEGDATVSGAYRNGGQADFLMLLAIDHTDKKVYQLQIDRDTMTDVEILGIFGNEVGTRILQICLSHSFGLTPEDNAKHTVRAVQHLLGGVEIDGYYVVNYTAVPVLNDALGGVQVHLDFDMTSVHEGWTKGSVITLHGKEAQDFVRERMTVGAGTNEERMIRQNEFLQNAIKLMNQKLSENLKFGESLLEQLQTLSTTNFTAKRLAEELNKAYKYEILAIEHPDGEYRLGDTGFMEFHMRENAATEWVLENLYTKVE